MENANKVYKDFIRVLSLHHSSFDVAGQINVTALAALRRLGVVGIQGIGVAENGAWGDGGGCNRNIGYACNPAIP